MILDTTGWGLGGAGTARPLAANVKERIRGTHMGIAFDRLSVRAKLAAILGVTIFALAATRALGLSQLGGFLERFDGYIQSVDAGQAALASAHEAQIGLARQLVAAQAVRRASAPTSREQAEREFAAATTQTESALERLQGFASALDVDPAPLRALRDGQADARERLRALARAGETILEHPQAAALRALEASLATRFGAARAEAAQAHAREVRIMQWTYVSMLVLVLGAGAAAYFLIAAMVTRPLARMVEVADTVAAGDLSSRIEETRLDELGQVMRALAGMNRGLAGLIGKVRDASGAISGASGDIAAANASLAERMTEQAAALEETAATMQQLTDAVASNAEHARRAAERASGASSVAERGGAEVRRVVDAMQVIDAGARRITDIIGVIDSIAFQTNILALNAAVEAARAGEQGRGFAVVAAEVRALAQKTSTAAGEIKELIGDSLARIAEGGSAVQSAGDTMESVVASVREVTDIIADIARVSVEQANGLHEVNRTVAAMDGRTRENSGLVDRAAEAARAMRAQAHALHGAVAAFRLAHESRRQPAPGAVATAA